jgi:hypothetical protein
MDLKFGSDARDVMLIVFRGVAARLKDPAAEIHTHTHRH